MSCEFHLGPALGSQWSRGFSYHFRNTLAHLQGLIVLWAKGHGPPQKLLGQEGNSHMGNIRGCLVQHKLKRFVIYLCSKSATFGWASGAGVCTGCETGRGHTEPPCPATGRSCVAHLAEEGEAREFHPSCTSFPYVHQRWFLSSSQCMTLYFLI